MKIIGLWIAVVSIAFGQEPQRAYRVGGGVTPPHMLQKKEPAYSEQARIARLEGTVVLKCVVDPEGNATKLSVTKSLGLGLDEKAIEAVSAWKFAPGQRAGKPVSVIASVEVNFRMTNRGPAWGLKRAAFDSPRGVSVPELTRAKYPSPRSLATSDITVLFDVDEKGSPANVRVQNETHSKAEAEIIDTVKRWKFNPAMKDKTPTRVPATFVFTMVG